MPDIINVLLPRVGDRIHGLPVPESTPADEPRDVRCPELPMHSVVLDTDGDVWQKRRCSGWRCVERDAADASDLAALVETYGGPVTLLHIPEQS